MSSNVEADEAEGVEDVGDAGDGPNAELNVEADKAEEDVERFEDVGDAGDVLNAELRRRVSDLERAVRLATEGRTSVSKLERHLESADGLVSKWARKPVSKRAPRARLRRPRRRTDPSRRLCRRQPRTGTA